MLINKKNQNVLAEK